MTIWALALLAFSARAANVAPRASAPSGGSQVRAVPSVGANLGGSLGTPSLGNLDVRGTIPSLPMPLPGLTNGMPAAYFVPPGALQFKKVDGQTAASAPSALGDAAPQATAADSAAQAAPRRPGGILPGGASGSANPALLPSSRDGSAAKNGLLPSLDRAGASALPANIAVESAGDDGRRLFDNSASHPSVDLSRFDPSALGSVNTRRESALLPSNGAARADGPRPSVPEQMTRDSVARRNPLDVTDYVPDSGLVAVRAPLPGAVPAADLGALKDAVISPLPLNPAEAGVLGGHAPLLSRPSRLTLGNEGLVVRVSPLPVPGDGLFKGRPAPIAPAPNESNITGGRRLVSTELIERGALLEAVSVADAAVGRGMLGLNDGDVPGVMAGALRLRGAKMPPPAPAAAPAPAKGKGLLLLSLLPVAAVLAARRFL